MNSYEVLAWRSHIQDMHFITLDGEENSIRATALHPENHVANRLFEMLAFRSKRKSLCIVAQFFESVKSRAVPASCTLGRSLSDPIIDHLDVLSGFVLHHDTEFSHCPRSRV